MSTVYLQKIVLDTETENSRTVLDWDILSAVGDWRVLSFLRTKPTWVEPHGSTNLISHPDRSSHLILLKAHPSWDETIAIYPVSTLEVNHNLIVENGVIKLNARRVLAGEEQTVWVVCVSARGLSGEKDIVKRAVEEARRLVGGRAKSTDTSGLWDELGFCTYESLGGSSASACLSSPSHHKRLKLHVGQRPTIDLLLSLVPDFPIKTFVIDDGWQDIRHRQPPSSPANQRRLFSFHGWDGMGANMGDVVSALKARGVEEVGVWVTLQGYWYGIDPDSHLIQAYNCQPHQTARFTSHRGGVVVPLETGREGDVQWLPHPSMAQQFWEVWFETMKAWGISFVKVDNQAHFDAIVSPTAAETHQAMWAGMLAAAQNIWGSVDRIIMCMSHNERMLNGPGGLDFGRPAGNLVFRNSDDFNLQYPETHTDFVRWNLYMSILTDHLSFIPDCDMFASSPSTLLPTCHALLRALSPGPTLLSDTLETTTDHALLSLLLGNTKAGDTKVVKMDSMIKAVPRRWFWDNLSGSGDGPGLVGVVEAPRSESRLLGMWNGRPHGRVVDEFCSEDIRDTDFHGEYAIWSLGLSMHNRRRVDLVDRHWKGSMRVVLENGECELFVVAKVWEINGKKIAVVGMLDKLAPLAGVDVFGFQDDELVIETKFDSGLSVLVFGNDKPRLVAMVDGDVIDNLDDEPVDNARLLTVPVFATENKGGKWQVRITATT
ncbi:hypothetical protein P7C73_g217, partial [Tremellales sp. Uapishka_1]